MAWPVDQNVDYSFCNWLFRCAEIGGLEGMKNEHVHDLDTDWDASGESSVLRMFDRPNWKKTRIIAFECIAE
jgi:hypothetical protein